MRDLKATYCVVDKCVAISQEVELEGGEERKRVFTVVFGSRSRDERVRIISCSAPSWLKVDCTIGSMYCRENESEFRERSSFLGRREGNGTHFGFGCSSFRFRGQFDRLAQVFRHGRLLLAGRVAG